MTSFKDTPFPTATAKVNIPDPENYGMRIVGYRIRAQDVGLNEAMSRLDKRDEGYTILSETMKGVIETLGLLARCEMPAAGLREQIGKVITALKLALEHQKPKATPGEMEWWVCARADNADWYPSPWMVPKDQRVIALFRQDEGRAGQWFLAGIGEALAAEELEPLYRVRTDGNPE